MIGFASAQALESWLMAHSVSTDSWGRTGAKTVANLWHEYEQGEILFEEDPPTRMVRVVQIILRREDYVLHELAQEFTDGRLRRREQPPSEKIYVGESQFAAAARCLREELGLDARDICLLQFHSRGGAYACRLSFLSWFADPVHDLYRGSGRCGFAGRRLLARE